MMGGTLRRSGLGGGPSHAQYLSEASVCNIKLSFSLGNLSLGKFEHIFFNLLTIIVCLSFHHVWFFLVNNFCNSCLSLAKSFIKSEE